MSNNDAAINTQRIDIPVKDLVPHSDDMVLLDSADLWHEQGLTASLEIRKDSLFYEPQGVPTWVGLEYMGQAIAAYAGFAARQDNAPVRIGFLVSCRRYEPTIDFFTLGTKLSIEVEAITFSDTGLQVFECVIMAAGDTVVKANLNVYMPDDVAAFMEENSA